MIVPLASFMMNSTHDLVIATPSEIKSRGSGLAMRAGIVDSPFGQCLIADSPRGICCLSFYDKADKEVANAEMRDIWPLADITWEPPHARLLAEKIFSSPRALSLFVGGTDFQIRVWQALLQIPMGGTTSYGELATLVGNPRAARATGSAVGANPISFLIPCHRVILGNGALGHYHWGPARKRAMLAWEATRAAMI